MTHHRRHRWASRSAWLLAAGVGLASVAFGAGTGRAAAGAMGSAGDTAVNATTTTSPTTSTTMPATASSTTSAPAITASLVPCSPVVKSGPCTADPTQLQVAFDPAHGITGVRVDWVGGLGRPQGAPKPSQVSVVLNVQNEVSCSGSPASSTVCWAWPSGLTDPVKAPGAKTATPWILNGTYQVTGCSASSASSCTASSAYSPRQLGIAVAPAAPSSIRTSSRNGIVTVSWAAAVNAEPDLVGYQMARNGQALYACSTDGAGPGAGNPCPSPLSTTDRPGQGHWTYTATALRFGVDPAASDTVSSPAVTSSIHVLPWVPTMPAANSAPAPGPVTGISLPPVPFVGTVQTLPLTTVPAQAATAYASPVPTVAGEDGGNVNTALPYSGDNPALSAPPAAAVGVRETALKHSVRGAASVALGLIALALAAHVWYLRGEIGRAAARAAARRQAGGPATQAGAAAG